MQNDGTTTTATTKGQPLLYAIKVLTIISEHALLRRRRNLNVEILTTYTHTHPPCSGRHCDLPRAAVNKDINQQQQQQQSQGVRVRSCDI